MRQVTYNVEKCSEQCPFYRESDGGGHCEGYTICDKHHKEIHHWNKEDFDEDGFPIWCGLPKSKYGDY